MRKEGKTGRGEEREREIERERERGGGGGGETYKEVRAEGGFVISAITK